ncbi:MAG: hypothetical protein ABH872_04270 [Candidatus Omnitrophota bacterium]
MAQLIWKLRWLILLLFFVPVVLSSVPVDFIDFGGDSAQYIILSESLAKGLGYRAVNYPDSPFFYHYPPFFPILLSPLIFLFGRDFFLMHMLIAVLGFLSLLAINKIFSNYAEEKFSFLVTVLFATSWPFVCYITQYILSDIPYLLVSSLSIYASIRYLRSDSFLNREAWITAICIVVSYFTRYAGITVFLSIVITLLISSSRMKVKKIAFIIFTFSFFYLIWQSAARILNPQAIEVYSKQFFMANPYNPALGTVISNPVYLLIRFWEGVNNYYEALGASILLTFIKKGELWHEVCSLCVMMLVFFGFRHFMRRHKACVFGIYFSVYFLLIIFWPFGRNARESIRFLLPVLPFIYFYIVALIKDFLTKACRLRNNFSLLLAFVLFLMINLYSLFPLPKTKYNYPLTVKNFLLMHDWMRKNVSSDSLIVSRLPSLTYLYTNITSTGYEFTQDSRELFKKLLDKNCDYILIDEISKTTPIYLVPAVKEFAASLEPVHREGATQLLKIKKTPF